MDSAVLKTAPILDPVEISEVNLHLKTSGENDYVMSLILTARLMMERYLNRSLMAQTWTGYSRRWHRELYLDYPPLVSVTHVKYYDENSDLQLLPDSTYWVNNKDQPGCVEFKYDFNPPTLEWGRPNAIEVEYVAGYGTGVDIPDPIKHAMKVLITDMYEHRGQYVIGNISNKLPGFIIDIVHSYKVYCLA